MSTKASRNYFIDILKIIAIVMIIITHDTYFVENYRRPFSVFILDMAVPIFMFVSGYNYAASWERHELTLKRSYDPKLIVRRLCRYIIPYTLIFAIVSILMYIFKGTRLTLSEHLIAYVKGGYGPGAYYTTVIIQFVLFAPLIYQLVSKLKTKGVVLAFAINLSFEIALTLGMPWPNYSRTLLRYLFILSTGMYMSLYSNGAQKHVPLNIISFLVGLFYLSYTQYIDAPHIFTRWTTTSMISGLYILPIILLLKRAYCSLVCQYIKHKKMIAEISSATFHIYLTQMTYYYVGLSRFIPFPVCIRIIISIIICITAGTLFYKASKFVLR